MPLVEELINQRFSLPDAGIQTGKVVVLIGVILQGGMVFSTINIAVVFRVSVDSVSGSRAAKIVTLVFDSVNALD